jgi:hypothetical protein
VYLRESGDFGHVLAYGYRGTGVLTLVRNLLGSVRRIDTGAHTAGKDGGHLAHEPPRRIEAWQLHDIMMIHITSHHIILIIHITLVVDVDVNDESSRESTVDVDRVVWLVSESDESLGSIAHLKERDRDDNISHLVCASCLRTFYVFCLCGWCDRCLCVVWLWSWCGVVVLWFL